MDCDPEIFYACGWSAEHTIFLVLFLLLPVLICLWEAWRDRLGR